MTHVEALNILDERLETAKEASDDKWVAALKLMRKLIIAEINKEPKPTKAYKQMNDFLDEIEREAAER
jgi:hypothetical protein